MSTTKKHVNKSADVYQEKTRTQVGCFRTKPPTGLDPATFALGKRYASLCATRSPLPFPRALSQSSTNSIKPEAYGFPCTTCLDYLRIGESMFREMASLNAWDRYFLYWVVSFSAVRIQRKIYLWISLSLSLSEKSKNLNTRQGGK